jgi:probable phosphoglycerate mutase
MIVQDDRTNRSDEGGPVLWLVRHGETTWNSRGWVQGQVDGARLTRRGRRQAREAAEQLAGHPVATVYSSDLYRARRTAAVIAARLGCDLRTDPRLRERCFGIAEGVAAAGMTPVVTGVRDGYVVDGDARAPGGESLHDVHRRCAAFLRDLSVRGPRGHVVVVAHGGSIRMMRAVIDGVDVHGLAWGTVPNASIHRVAYP